MNDEIYTLLGGYKYMLSHQIDFPDDTWEIYQVHFIDWTQFMPQVFEVMKGTRENTIVIASIMKRFRDAGWEGDGVLQVGWIPTFMVNKEDTFGSLFWHVKQSNNGTSWILVDPDEITIRRTDIISQWHKK